MSGYGRTHWGSFIQTINDILGIPNSPATRLPQRIFTREQRDKISRGVLRGDIDIMEALDLVTKRVNEIGILLVWDEKKT